MSSVALTPQKFDFTAELHKTMVHSLVTTFGLDFLLFEDKKGGDVDTIHNVRQGIWATEEARQAYNSRGAYDGHEYHQHKDYIARGQSDKKKQQSGELVDNYRGTTLNGTEKRQLDHTISAYEIHHDAGRVLAELSGVELANQESNFQSTNAYLNNKKSNLSMQEFVEKLPTFIQNKKESIYRDEQKLKQMPDSTLEQQHQKRIVQDKIRKNKEHLKTLEEYNANKDKMLKADEDARKHYDMQINWSYYTSSKFLGKTAQAATNQGFRMGVRQAIGLVLAEIWFELKEAIPTIVKNCCNNFIFEEFWIELKTTLFNIVERIKIRFKDILVMFKDGFIGGILSSITTTILNMFFSSTKLLGKLIRESWSNLVQISKLIAFNPQNLEFGDLMKEISRLILVSVSTIAGVALNQHLMTVLTIPFGTEISAFLSALFSGLLMVGMGYFLDYSPMMKKVWNFLNSLKNKYDVLLNHVKEANAEIDRYMAELASLEFNLNIEELQILKYDLSLCSTEAERTVILKKEIEKRNIDLPFEMDSNESVKQWLKSLKPKN